MPEVESVFLSEWARARAAEAPASREEIERLRALALSPRERILIAAVEIDAGRRSGDEALFGAGIQRFRTGLHHEQLEVLGCFTDIAVLGTPERRRGLLKDVWAIELGVEDPALRLLGSRSISDAAILIEHPDRSRLQQLGRGLQQELQRELAWLALDSHISQRDSTWLQLLKSPLLALRPEAAGYWEFELVRSITELSQGRFDDAIGRVRRLAQTHAKGSWRLQSVRRAVAAYSPLAAPRAREWAAAIDGPAFTISEAASPAEELGAFMATAASGVWTQGSLDLALAHLESRPTELFLFLLQFSRESFGPVIAHKLQGFAREPDRFRALPWPSRVDAFADACRVLPPDDGFQLLAAAASCVPTPQLQAALIDTLQGASASALDGVDRERLSRLLRDNVEGLSSGTRQMLGRGVVYRAIVDGSNVVLAGVHRHDRPGSFAYYEQMVGDLMAAGFREIITYFDASLRHGFPGRDWAKIEALEAMRKAMVVRGVADVQVIKEYMKSPQVSWIVTNDDYRDHIGAFPGFDQYWFAHRLHFHVDQDDRLVWDRSLGSAELPAGAPKKPFRHPGSK